MHADTIDGDTTRILRWLACATTAVSIIAGCTDSEAVTTASTRPLVTIASGTLQGGVAGGVEFFKGVPYAAPPLGGLRWAPPQPSAHWSGVRQATQYGHDCDQEPGQPLRTTPGEDCLYLNVWRPVGAHDLPVMVWIYGGGFVSGGTSPAVYDGSHLAATGVVLVGFNYRLGRFGFFAFPALTAEHPTGLLGNYGYMDQIAALQWVRANIAAFGGDPHNVTVFGESAGGLPVHMLLTSPLAAGLFQKAAIESGGGRNNPMRGRQLARNLPGLGPMVDGHIVVESPEAAYRSGHFAHVPLLIGANSADLGISSARTMAEALAPFGADRGRALAAYDPEHSSDVHLLGTAVTAQDEATAQAANTYWTNFARTGNPNGNSLPTWPAYWAKSEMLMNFTPSGPMPMRDPWHVRLDLTAAHAR